MGNPSGRGGFQPGVSGNPGGRPKEVREVKVLARERTASAIEVLTKIMEDPKAAPAARVAACRELLDRGYGRPESSVNAKIETETKPVEPNLAPLTPEERALWDARIPKILAKVFGGNASGPMNGHDRE